MPNRRKPAARRKAPVRGAKIERREQQWFVIGEAAFDVERAHALLRGRSVSARIPVVDWVRMYGLDAINQDGDSCSGGRIAQIQGFDVAHAMRADLSRPLIVALLPGRRGGVYPLVIDGRHRLYRAWREKVEYLPAQVLTPDESVEVATDEPMRDLMHLYRWPGWQETR